MPPKWPWTAPSRATIVSRGGKLLAEPNARPVCALRVNFCRLTLSTNGVRLLHWSACSNSRPSIQRWPRKIWPPRVERPESTYLYGAIGIKAKRTLRIAMVQSAHRSVESSARPRAAKRRCARGELALQVGSTRVGRSRDRHGAVQKVDMQDGSDDKRSRSASDRLRAYAIFKRPEKRAT